MIAMVQDVYKFDYDKWVKADPAFLVKGDVISVGNITAIFSHTDSKNPKRLCCDSLPESPMHIMLGDDHDFTTQAMDCVGSDVVRFNDGTCQITSFSNGCKNVYSPRLTASELESFCKRNIRFYQTFYDENRNDVEEGRPLAFSCFWS